MVTGKIVSIRVLSIVQQKYLLEQSLPAVNPSFKSMGNRYISLGVQSCSMFEGVGSDGETRYAGFPKYSMPQQ